MPQLFGASLGVTQKPSRQCKRPAGACVVTTLVNLRVALLATVSLSRRTIEGGPTDLGHRANIIDREMIGVARGQEFQCMRQAFVVRGVGPGTSLVDAPECRLFAP